jgi:hypothetical protein
MTNRKPSPDYFPNLTPVSYQICSDFRCKFATKLRQPSRGKFARKFEYIKEKKLLANLMAGCSKFALSKFGTPGKLGANLLPNLNAIL